MFLNLAFLRKMNDNFRVNCALRPIKIEIGTNLLAN